MGLFEKLLDSMDHPILTLAQFRSVASQITQILNRGRRHNAPFQEPVLEQVGDPLTGRP